MPEDGCPVRLKSFKFELEEEKTMSEKQPTIGEKIKRRREMLGYSLRKVAELTGLSASFLSQVELNRNSMSLSSLHATAAALDVPLIYFLDDKVPGRDFTGGENDNQNIAVMGDEYNKIVRKDERNQLIMQKSGVTYELMVPSMNRKMVAFQRSLSPGFEHPVRRVLKEPTEEFVYVVSGSLFVELTTGKYCLNEGDSMYFDGYELLGFECASTDEDAVWNTVITPSIF